MQSLLCLDFQAENPAPSATPGRILQAPASASPVSYLLDVRHYLWPAWWKDTVRFSPPPPAPIPSSIKANPGQRKDLRVASVLRLGLSLILRSARERSSAAAGRKQFCKNNHTQPGNCLPLGLLLCRRPHSLQERLGIEFTAARTSLPDSRLQCCKLRISSGLCFSWELQVHFLLFDFTSDLLIVSFPLSSPG